MDLATSNLEKLIKDCENKLEEPLVIEIFGQVLNGLRYAHAQKCAHLDLKPENILIIDKTLKIADWGGSLLLQSGKTTKLRSVAVTKTVGFVAPEIEDEDFGLQEMFNYYLCDVYSLGILMFRLCGVPYNEIKKMPKNNQKFHDPTISEFLDDFIGNKYSKELKDLLRRMTYFDFKKRPGIEEVLTYYEKNW